MTISGKRAVVTGCSSGIGLSLARALVAQGVEVHGLARRPCPEPEVQSHPTDLRDPAAVRRSIALIGADGPVDILALCAGVNVPGRTLGELSDGDWEQLLSTNLTAAFSSLSAALPLLRTSRGAVVAISSVSAVWPDRSGIGYQAAKHGVLGLMRAAAYEELGSGIRFTTVMPGLTSTPLLEQRPQPPDQSVRDAALRPEDVAAACVFALSQPESACISELTIMPTRIQAPGRT